MEMRALLAIAVPDIGSSTILRYLDRGMMGILGPHIATEADARQLVRACYFGPLGECSFGANRGTDYNAGIADKDTMAGLLWEECLKPMVRATETRGRPIVDKEF